MALLWEYQPTPKGTTISPVNKERVLENRRQAAPDGGYSEPIRRDTLRPGADGVRPRPGEPVRDDVTTTPHQNSEKPIKTSPWELPRKNASSTRLFDDRVASNTKAIKERTETRVKQDIKHLAEITLVAIDRLEKIIVRIESRASKLETEGANVSAVRTNIETAKIELAAARADLSTIQAAARSVFNGQNMAAVHESISPARTAIKSARAHLQNAHQAVRKAANELISASKTVRKNQAATTPSSN